MKPSDEEEHQRFLGFPISLWPRGEPGNGRRHGEREGTGSNLALLRHPIAWFRWRISVRRRGPYTPDFKEFCRRRQSDIH
jgi:hypothetical protein